MCSDLETWNLLLYIFFDKLESSSIIKLRKGKLIF
jgi:hypothetical protein